jgi:predicted phage-related endonuclease
MAIKYYYDLIQHTDAWRDARCGLLSASEMERIITPAKLQVASNDKSRSHMDEIAAQRINKYVAPTWFGGDMERGVIDEIDARELYRQHYGEVSECGLITNDKWGFTLAFSPDGLVGEDGQIEVKSQCQKYHTNTILANDMPNDFLIQVQTGLLVSERKWCDFISYCSGMPMFTHRVYADEFAQAAILTAAKVFHDAVDARIKIWEDRMNDKTLRLIPTERKILEGDITA